MSQLRATTDDETVQEEKTLEMQVAELFEEIGKMRENGTEPDLEWLQQRIAEIAGVQPSANGDTETGKGKQIKSWIGIAANIASAAGIATVGELEEVALTRSMLSIIDNIKKLDELPENASEQEMMEISASLTREIVRATSAVVKISVGGAWATRVAWPWISKKAIPFVARWLPALVMPVLDFFSTPLGFVASEQLMTLFQWADYHGDTSFSSSRS